MKSIFVCFFLFLVSPCLSELCNRNDKKVLLQIKKSLKNPSILSSWDSKTDCCTNWTGIDCSSVTNAGNKRVTGLQIVNPYDHTMPIAKIPTEIGNLSFLKSLDLGSLKNLTGTIPTTISKLKHLELLRITGSKISGSIPGFIGNFMKLKTLDLSENKLTGPIPSSIGSIPTIDFIMLANNQLTGSIPESFGSFKATVTQLNLYNNRLSGTIPKSLSKSRFIYVNLFGNKLRGDLSMFLGPNQRTYSLDVSNNELKFDFSKTKFQNSLAYLHIQHNQIFGKIPQAVADLPDLNDFDFSYNRLCGKIPAGGKLQSYGAEPYSHNRCLCGAPLKQQC